MAAPKARGRQAALAQLAEKQLASGVGAPASAAAVGGGLGGAVAAGFAASAFGHAVASSAPAPPSGKPSGTVGLALERSTFAERVADVKDNVERARADYRNKATSALGSRPAAGPAAITASLHSRFADLEAKWGEVMDYTKIDPWSTATPGVKAAASGLARNKLKLDREVDTIIDDLWDGVSSGYARQMNFTQKDDAMRSALTAQGTGGRPLSPTRRGGGGFDPYGGGAMGASFNQPPLALELPERGLGHVPPPIDDQFQTQQIVSFQAPPAGAQDFETRRQLEMMRQDIVRLESQVLAAVEAEEAELPPPPPLIEKHPAGLKALHQAADYEDMVYRIKTSEVGAEGDSGGTLCNSVHDPNMRLIMPSRGRMNVRAQIEALTKECQELKEATVHEFGGPAARARMADMQQEMKKSIKNKRR